MNRRKQNILFFMIAVFSILTVVFKVTGAKAFTGLVTFPLEQIAYGLRYLSLSGSVQNVVAIVLYVILCFLPLGYLLIRVKTKKAVKSESILVLLSGLLYGGIYLYINPGYMHELFLSKDMSGFSGVAPLVKMSIGSTIWSVVACYVVVRLLNHLQQQETMNLLKTLHGICICLIAVIIYWMLGAKLTELVVVRQDVMAQNTMMPSNLNTTLAWLVIQYLMECIPWILDLWILKRAIALIESLKDNTFTEEVVEHMNQLAICSRQSLIAISLFGVLENVVQLVFSQYILKSHYGVQIPLFSLALVFAVHLITRYFANSVEIKEENDSFI